MHWHLYFDISFRIFQSISTLSFKSVFSIRHKMLFFLEKYVKTFRKNFSLSSKIFLNFFLFSHTKNSIFLGLVSKRGIFSRAVQATPLQSIHLPIQLSPEQYWSTALSPCNSFPFLQWWFAISKVMSGVLRLIQVKSEFSYDLFLWYWLKFNFIEQNIGEYSPSKLEEKN